MYLLGRVHDARFSVAKAVFVGGNFSSRAMARPMRFAADPPLVRVPAKPPQPTASASQRTTMRSMATPAGEDRHAVIF